MINQLVKNYPDYSFKKSDVFFFSPETKTIFYDSSRTRTDEGKLSLLHELGHAILGHKTYDHDIDLLGYELAAWKTAQTLALEYSLDIEQDYVEGCLDSYRDWLRRRSTCPECSFVCFQTSHLTYDCFNCGCSWKVSSSQICRIQRTKINSRRH